MSDASLLSFICVLIGDDFQHTELCLQPMRHHIEHAIGITPLVIEPGQHVDQIACSARLAGIDDARARIVIKIARRQRFLSVTEDAAGILCGSGQCAIDVGCAGILVEDTFCGPIRELPMYAT